MSSANLILREAQPGDRLAIVGLLAAAFAASDVGAWLDPDPATRLPHAVAHFRTAVDRALAIGSVRVADERGHVLGAALWIPFPASAVTPGAPAGSPAAEVATGPTAAGVADRRVVDRLRLLERLLDERHPSAPAHHHLAYLGVHPDRQGQGIGSCLLIGHHALLHVAGIPAYLEASDPRNRQLYLRHGYTDVGTPVVLPTGIPVWPMWRPPAPAGAVATPPTTDIGAVTGVGPVSGIEGAPR
jgi:GNAT superfamily N-acetyltransferase